tara:strand:- start:37 stop:144 length:108 start_codon:yes stop_codon:yes gene_type:complete
MIELFINAPIELKVIILFGLVMVVKEIIKGEQTTI